MYSTNDMEELIFMIFNDFHFYSYVLGIETAAYILMPEQHVMAQSGKPLPVVYLLHGLSDDHTMWLRQTRVEQYARDKRVMIVMPAANRSFYMDMAHGARYDTFIAQELPQVIETFFPVCKQREGRFAVGLSMGGYGALKLGLTRPDRYAAVASFSGALGMDRCFTKYSQERISECADIYGSEAELLAGPGNLMSLAEKADPAQCPKMYVSCGTEDSLFPDNQRFADAFCGRLPIEYHTEPGVHSWDFWDRQVAYVLRSWLPLEDAPLVF